MKIEAAHHRSGADHLSRYDLEHLLSNADEPAPDRAVVDHLEQCAECQSQLTSLASGDDWWDEARSLLSGEQLPRWEPDLSASPTFSSDVATGRPWIEDELLALLGRPNHPEMLGRLGRYDIEKVIGSGGMGIVLKAHDSELNRPIAIKLLAPNLSHVGAARERFAREGRAAAAVVHEHVVAIYNVEADGKLPFLIMQYVAGRSLQMRVDDDGPLDVEAILRIGMQAAAGLAAAHAQGLVHRDVKPSNILLEDTVERTVLTDFGLARARDDMSLTQTGIIAGTPHYMSPEQATGGPIDARSDLFSLGGVLYFMATGHPPFRASGALAVLHRIWREKHRPVRQTNKDIPDELADLMDRLLEKKPNRRPASAEVVRQQLESQLSHLQRFGRGRRSLAEWRRSMVRHRLRLGLAAAIVAAMWLAAVWFWPQPTAPLRQTESSPPEAAPDAIVQAELGYDDELEAARKEMHRASGASLFLHGEDSWRREIEKLKRGVERVESRENSQ